MKASYLKALIIIFLSFFTVSKACSQTQKWAFHLSGKKRYLLNFVKDGRTIKSFIFDNLIDENPIESAKLLAYKKIGQFYYVLIWYEYPSNISNRQGYCGAGYEEFVATLKIAENLKIKSFTPLQVSSCFNNIYKKYAFDKRHPEKGFILTDQ